MMLLSTFIIENFICNSIYQFRFSATIQILVFVPNLKSKTLDVNDPCSDFDKVCVALFYSVNSVFPRDNFYICIMISKLFR